VSRHSFPQLIPAFHRARERGPRGREGTGGTI
jgi:hypothetical protein